MPVAESFQQQGKNLTNDDILRQLEVIRTQTAAKKAGIPIQPGYTTPEQYQTFMPQRLGTKTRDDSDYYNLLQGVELQGKNATALEAIKQANLENKKRADKAKQNAANSLGRPGQYSNNEMMDGADWTAQNMPQYSTPTNANGITGRLKNYTWRGYGLKLDSGVADNFIGFLNALSAKGYKIHSIGSYSNRNIAGTNTPSLHKRGLAIDINPTQNPVAYGQTITNLPPGIGALAAKYGLKWGGASIYNKRDAMHFSFPFPGYSY